MKNGARKGKKKKKNKSGGSSQKGKRKEGDGYNHPTSISFMGARHGNDRIGTYIRWPPNGARRCSRRSKSTLAIPKQKNKKEVFTKRKKERGRIPRLRLEKAPSRGPHRTRNKRRGKEKDFSGISKKKSRG